MAVTYDVVVAGHICLDVIPDLSAMPAAQFAAALQPGRLLQVGPAAFSTGGPVSNTGLALHKLGIATRLMGKVGSDLFGQAVRQIVASYGAELAEGMVVDPAAGTSYTIVISPPGQDRILLHSAGANDSFAAADVRYELLSDARLFHFGYPPLMRRMYERRGEELVEVYSRAKRVGVTTALDMSLPDPLSPAGQVDWPAVLRAALPYVDIFLPSIEEILYMMRRPVYEALYRQASAGDILPLITPALLSDVSEELLALGTRIVGLKLGYRGFYLRTAGRQALAGMGRAAPADPDAWARRELWAPCFCAHVVGTTGSGDATIAGFLSGLLRGLGPEETVIAAVAVGACNVEAADALSGLRPWDATLGRVAAGWRQHDLQVDDPGWQRKQATGLWLKGSQGL